CRVAADRTRRPLPTRRSSDLPIQSAMARASSGGHADRVLGLGWVAAAVARSRAAAWRRSSGSVTADLGRCSFGIGSPQGLNGTRSEEHTSELQSRENLVCRLL